MQLPFNIQTNCFHTLAAAILGTGFALAEKPSDHAWQAQWIGPVLPPPVDIQGASWIWVEEPGVDPVKGRIGMKITRKAESFHLALDSPPGTKATVCIPVAEFRLKGVRARDTKVWLNGKHTGTLPGLAAGPQMDGHATFVVDPGQWQFEAR